ncbi:MAG TPA: PHB depolymerase family esterase [Microthrixaceae bacterium]|nr:PHB depolymerase family esterase [Microthrixaceae bacterium]
MTIEAGGVTRTAVLDVPAGAAGTAVEASAAPRPLLVSLHPFAMDPAIWDSYSALATAGTARGYVVVTPLGSAPGPRWAVPGGLAADVDDLAFISALVDHIGRVTCVDRNRVFAVGFSAGAAMAQALSCTMPDRFAAVAGSGGVNLTSLCPGAPPTDVLVLHGTADPIVPPAGSQVPFSPPVGLAVLRT